jgi:hypothetical protein
MAHLCTTPAQPLLTTKEKQMPANNPPSMPLASYSDKELVHIVDNKPNATPLERELANRIDAVLQMAESMKHVKEHP